uniref:Uncharacterized protein n=1 Tax=Anguilla anguilla TaxID=7936 RepID=A0A0E9PWK6_ANGAN
MENKVNRPLQKFIDALTAVGPLGP